MTIRKTLSATALTIAATLASTAHAASLPLAQLEHSGTYVCTWPNLQKAATYVLDIHQSTLMVDRGAYKIAGFIQVASDDRATVYSVGDGQQSGTITFKKDGQVQAGTGLCERKD